MVKTAADERHVFAGTGLRGPAKKPAFNLVDRAFASDYLLPLKFCDSMTAVVGTGQPGSPERRTGTGEALFASLSTPV